jgi:hypothetical protein
VRELEVLVFGRHFEVRPYQVFQIIVIGIVSIIIYTSRRGISFLCPSWARVFLLSYVQVSLQYIWYCFIRVLNQVSSLYLDIWLKAFCSIF